MRDFSDGWRVPRPGTKAYKIYVMLKSGLPRARVAAQVGVTLNYIAQIVWKHSHWDAHRWLQSHYRRVRRMRKGLPVKPLLEDTPPRKPFMPEGWKDVVRK